MIIDNDGSFQRRRIIAAGERYWRTLRLVKSVFKPLIRTAGKTIVKAANSDVGKQVFKNLKDQAIESGVHLPTAAMRGDDMGEAFNNEIQTVKRKAADAVEQVYEGSQKKQRKTTTTPKKVKKPTVDTSLFNKVNVNHSHANSLLFVPFACK